MREKIVLGDRVVASTRKEIIGVVVDKNTFGMVLVEWPDGSTYWVKRRHLLLEVELEISRFGRTINA